MENMMNEVKKLLLKHDYITTIKKIDDGCVVTYPQPKLLNDYPRLIESFVFKRGNKPGFYAATTYDKEDEKGRFIEVPEYALRLFVICEISACNTKIPIDPSLMVFIDENEQYHEDIEDVIAEPSTEEDRQKEGFLYRLIIEARNDGFPPEYEKIAETHGVDVGYKLIRKFYE